MGISLRKNLENALLEDGYDCDVTAALLGEKSDQIAHAVLVSKSAGVFSGAAVVSGFSELLPELKFVCSMVEGQEFQVRQRLAMMSGPVSKLLAVERTFINFVSHACGVATRTREYSRRLEGTGTRLLCTRKTLPGLKEVQLAAVQAGGGLVHRRTLSDGILIKENHQAYETGAELLRRAHAVRSPLHGIEIEVQDLAELPGVLEGKPDVIMLDNFTPDQVREAVRVIAGRSRVEVSGGIQLQTIADFALPGVDYISVGALTHSAPSLDMSLDFEGLGHAPV